MSTLIKRILFIFICVLSLINITFTSYAVESNNDTTPPSITVTNGNPSSLTPPPYDVTFSVTDDSGLASVTVNGRNVGASGVKYNVSWAVTSNCTLSIVATDIYGNSSSATINITNIGVETTTEVPATEAPTTEAPTNMEPAAATEVDTTREPVSTKEPTSTREPAATTEAIITWGPVTTEADTSTEEDTIPDKNDSDKNKPDQDHSEPDQPSGKENDSTNKGNKEYQKETIDGKVVEASKQADKTVWRIIISAIIVIMVCLAGLLAYAILSISEKEKQKMIEELENQEKENPNTQYMKEPQIGGNIFKNR